MNKKLINYAHKNKYKNDTIYILEHNQQTMFSEHLQHYYVFL